MFRGRRTRLLTALLALISLLFMQLATANYVCPSSNAAGNTATQASMPCAASMSIPMDEDQPALCHAHCQAEKQSLDKHEVPAPIAIGAVSSDYWLPVIAQAYVGAQIQAPHLHHATAPPVAIQNCCFRI